MEQFRVSSLEFRVVRNAVAKALYGKAFAGLKACSPTAGLRQNEEGQPRTAALHRKMGHRPASTQVLIR